MGDTCVLNDYIDWLTQTYSDITVSDIAARLDHVNRDIFTNGIVRHKKTKQLILTGYDYLQFYDWDLYFENIYALYSGESRFCFSNLDVFFSLQKRNGFIKRSFGTKPYGKFHPFKPFIAQIVLLGCKTINNYSYAKANFKKIEKFLNYYYKRYDFDKNLLCCWINADASGMDNQNSRILKNGHGEGVDLNCYLYREWLAMSLLAKKTDQAKKSNLYQEKAENIKYAINKYLWDEKTGFYYDRNDRTNTLNMVKGISGLVPLWAGVASHDQAHRLVKEHLVNANEFASPYPIPTLSMDSSAYEQYGANPPSGFCNWNGPLWVPMNYMIFHGLMDYGFIEEAKEIALKTFEAVFLKNNVTREYYNAITAEGYGRNPFYGWSSLAYYMPLEFFLKYSPASINDEAVRPLGALFDSTWKIDQKTGQYSHGYGQHQ